MRTLHPRLPSLFRRSHPLVLFTLLAACGTSTVSAGTISPTATTTSRGATSTSTPALTNSSKPALTFNSAASADLDGLHIQTDGVDCSAWLVLDDPSATFDSGSLQAVDSYTIAFLHNYYEVNLGALGGQNPPVTFTTQFAATLGRLPQGLSVLPGGISYQPNKDASCSSVLTLTNTGTTTVQVDGLAAVLTADSVANTRTYDLVDVCTIAPSDGACTNILGGVPPCSYSADVHLPDGQSGTRVTAPLYVAQGTGTCAVPLTLAPAESAQVDVFFYSKTSTLYALALSLAVTIRGDEMSVSLPSPFDSVVAFRGQSACYGLSGNMFVLESGFSTDRRELCI